MSSSSLRLPAASLLCALLAGCAGAGRATVDPSCSDDTDCVAQGFSGPCLASPRSPSHYCTVDERNCISSLRWSERAGDGLANLCVDAARSDGGLDANPRADSAIDAATSAPIDAAIDPTRDLSAATSEPDLSSSAPDLATAPPPVDAAVPADLAMAVIRDLAVAPVPDLATLPDLTVPRDFTIPPDFAPPPDLLTLPDLIAPPDLAMCAIVGCTSGNESCDGCSHARTIGRKSAAGGGGWSAYNYNCYLNRFPSKAGCSEGAGDDTYRIFLRTGEQITATVSTDTDCNGNGFGWLATLAAYVSPGCGTQVCGGAPVACSSGKFTPNLKLTATQDGWYLLVVDGPSAFDEGYYTLNVRLSNCLVPGCECP